MTRIFKGFCCDMILSSICTTGIELMVRYVGVFSTRMGQFESYLVSLHKFVNLCHLFYSFKSVSLMDWEFMKPSWCTLLPHGLMFHMKQQTSRAWEFHWKAGLGNITISSCFYTRITILSKFIKIEFLRGRQLTACHANKMFLGFSDAWRQALPCRPHILLI